MLLKLAHVHPNLSSFVRLGRFRSSFVDTYVFIFHIYEGVWEKTTRHSRSFEEYWAFTCLAFSSKYIISISIIVGTRNQDLSCLSWIHLLDFNLCYLFLFTHLVIHWPGMCFLCLYNVYLKNPRMTFNTTLACNSTGLRLTKRLICYVNTSLVICMIASALVHFSASLKRSGSPFR